jgi:threonine dehydrogenase-like Zn-dependent dehydrogenase
LLEKIEAGLIDPSFVVTLEDAPKMYKKFRDKKDGVITEIRSLFRAAYGPPQPNCPLY